MNRRVLIGAGEQRWDGWEPTGREQLDLLDPLSFARWFSDDRAEALVCEHVWEHLDLDEARAAARTCFEFLVPGGLLRVAVPDGLFPNEAYQKLVQVGGPGPADHPAAGHKVVHDHRTLVPVFADAGFDVTLLEWWDVGGQFHEVPWRPDEGPIARCIDLDTRNRAYRDGTGPPGFTSLVLDARRPG